VQGSERGGRDPRSWIGWAVGLVVLIGVVALTVHVSSCDDEFSRYNPSWNGTSAYFSALEGRGAVAVDDPAALAGNATLLVVAPGRAPTAAEADAYRAFVRSGGTLVLADDFGAGNALLAAVGSGMRLDQRNLSSMDRAFELPAAPLGFPVQGAPLGANLSPVVFDHPVAVTGGAPFLTSSRLSWMDDHGNGRPDLNESLGLFVLAASEKVGAGTVVAVGDASLFINAMQDLRIGDNGVLLARLVPDGVLVDRRLSRTAVANGPVGTVLWLQERPVLIVAVTALALAALAWRTGGARRREET
jgi:hypothetical protein